MSPEARAPSKPGAAHRDGERGDALAAVLATLAFALAATLIVVLDRVGMPERFVAALACLVVVVGLAVLGVAGRTMRLSRFFVAAHALPAAPAALASATLVFILALAGLPGFHGGSTQPGEARALLGGVAGGLLAAAIAVNPMLRRSGAFSITDLLAARFPGRLFRLATAVTTATIGALLALAGLRIAVPALASGTGLSAGQAAALSGAALALLLAPGGFLGAQRAALFAGGGALAGFAGLAVFLRVAPAGWIAAAPGAVPAPLDLLAGLRQIDLAAPHGGQIALALAVLLGIVTLPPLLQTGLAAASPRAAARAGIGTLLWLIAFVLLSSAALGLAAPAFATLFDAGTPPAWLLEPGPAGAPSFCGEAPRRAVARLSEILQACSKQPGFSGQLRSADVAVDGLYLLASLPRLLAVNPAARALVTAVVASLGLALAAGGVQALACAIGHDALRRRLGQEVLTSARLALTRLAMLVATAGLCIAAPLLPVAPGVFEGLAVALGGATLTPLLLLALWPRAASGHALTALAGGATGFVLATAGGRLAGGFADLATGALVGCGCALLLGFGLSLSARKRPEAGAAARALWRGDFPLLRQGPTI